MQVARKKASCKHANPQPQPELRDLNIVFHVEDEHAPRLELHLEHVATGREQTCSKEHARKPGIAQELTKGSEKLADAGTKLHIRAKRSFRHETIAEQ